jgi:hypothetical protein
MRTVVFLALSCGCLAGTLQAQVRNVPADLVFGLFAHSLTLDSTQTMQILVGKAPANIPLPALGLPIIGAMQHEHGTSIVYRVSTELKEAHRNVQAKLRAAGWKSLAAPDQPDVGFVGIEAEIMELMPFCRGEEMVMIQPAAIRSDLHVLKIDYMRMGGCGDSGAGWTSYGGLNVVGLHGSGEIPLPKLEPPRAAQVIGSAIPGTVSSFASSAFVVSDLSTAQIIEHYGAQMRAKGWRSGGVTTGEVSSVYTWQVTQDGKEWLASLVATLVSERRHVVEINVYNLTQLTR